jgi:hypothetical protein
MWRVFRQLFAIVLLALTAAIVIPALNTTVVIANAAQPTREYLYHWGTVPVGFTLAGLQHHILTPGSIREIDGEIATAKSYGANTIRLQITQNRLTSGNGNLRDPVYLSYIESVVAYGRSLGMTMVLNAQTEYAPGFRQGSGWVNKTTMSFWRIMMRIYANVHGVQFDLFNEPRHEDWGKWFMNTQALVTMIRKHANNWIWLEGPKYASTLENVPMLKGGRLIYTYHHPGAPWPGMAKNNAATWHRAFGYLADQDMPVVDGEFINDAKTYHLPTQTLHQYLRYAKRHNIGMLVFGLKAHRLLTEYMRA